MTVTAPRFNDIEPTIDDPVAVLRLNRPEKRNAFTYDTLREIRAAIDACAADPCVVGIVITGNGRGFCAGLDAQTLAEVTSAPAARRTESESDALPGIFSYLLEVPKPVIAAVNGVAAGSGLILAMIGDLRYRVAQREFYDGVPEARIDRRTRVELVAATPGRRRPARSICCG
jgi:enoyl-CoA hydratase/carnithine racemase